MMAVALVPGRLHTTWSLRGEVPAERQMAAEWTFNCFGMTTNRIRLQPAWPDGILPPACATRPTGPGISR